MSLPFYEHVVSLKADIASRLITESPALNIYPNSKEHIELTLLWDKKVMPGMVRTMNDALECIN